MVAYYTVTADADEVTAEALRAHVSASLPEYMVPAAYVRLEAPPLTPNGKLDRKALPAPGGDAYGRAEYEAPIGPTESAIAEIWGDVLGVERVGRHDNFFDLGGHSLLAIRLVTKIRETSNHSLPVCAVFESPTIKAMGSKLKVDVVDPDGDDNSG